MSAEDDDDWDAEGFEPDTSAIIIPAVELEVPEVDEKKEPKTKAPTAKGKKPKTSDKDGDASSEPARVLTGKEAEDLAKQAELAMIAATYGTSEENGLSPSIDGDMKAAYSKLNSLEQFKSYADDLGTMLASRASNAHYADFLKQLVLNACENVVIELMRVLAVESKHVRMLSTLLKTKADDLAIAEKKKAKTPAKPTIKTATAKGTGNRRANDFDDYGGDGGYDDAEDFM